MHPGRSLFEQLQRIGQEILVASAAVKHAAADEDFYGELTRTAAELLARFHHSLHEGIRVVWVECLFSVSLGLAGTKYFLRKEPVEPQERCDRLVSDIFAGFQEIYRTLVDVVSFSDLHHKYGLRVPFCVAFDGCPDPEGAALLPTLYVPKYPPGFAEPMRQMTQSIASGDSTRTIRLLDEIFNLATGDAAEGGFWSIFCRRAIAFFSAMRGECDGSDFLESLNESDLCRAALKQALVLHVVFELQRVMPSTASYAYFFPSPKISEKRAGNQFENFFSGSMVVLTSASLQQETIEFERLLWELTILYLNLLIGSRLRETKARAEEAAALLPKWAHNMRAPTSVLKGYTIRLEYALKDSRFGEADLLLRMLKAIPTEIDDNCELLKDLGVYQRHPEYVRLFLDRGFPGGGDRSNVSLVEEVIQKSFLSTVERALLDERDKAEGIRFKCFAARISGWPAGARFHDNPELNMFQPAFDTRSHILSFRGLLTDDQFMRLQSSFSGVTEEEFGRLCVPFTRQHWLEEFRCARGFEEMFRAFFGGENSTIDISFDYDRTDIKRCKLPPQNETRPGLGGAASVYAIFVPAYRFVITELLWNALVHCDPLPGSPKRKISIHMAADPEVPALGGFSGFRFTLTNTIDPIFTSHAKEQDAIGSTGQGRAFISNIVDAFSGSYSVEEPERETTYRVSLCLPCNRLDIGRKSW